MLGNFLYNSFLIHSYWDKFHYNHQLKFFRIKLNSIFESFVFFRSDSLTKRRSLFYMGVQEIICFETFSIENDFCLIFDRQFQETVENNQLLLPFLKSERQHFGKPPISTLFSNQKKKRMRKTYQHLKLFKATNKIISIFLYFTF